MISTFAVAYAQIDGTRLYVPHPTVPAGAEARIVIEMPPGTTLGNLETISWSVMTITGYQPHVDIILADDIDVTENEDSLTAELAVNNPAYSHPPSGPYGVWLKTFELAADDGYGVIDGDTVLWVTRHGAGEKDAPYGTLDELRDGTVHYPDREPDFPEILGPPDTDPDIYIDEDVVVLRLEIEVDNWLGEADAYVKDILVMGPDGTVLYAEVKAVRTLTLVPVEGGTITAYPDQSEYYEYYDGTGDIVQLTPHPATDWVFDHWIDNGFEAGAAIPLEVEMNENHVVEAVFTFVPVVSISVSPPSVSFIGAIAGRTFDPEVTLTVSNTGNTGVDVTADVPGELAGDVFFKSYLRLDGKNVGEWSPQPIPKGEKVLAPVTLDLSLETEPGQYTSTLVFWAEWSGTP